VEGARRETTPFPSNDGIFGWCSTPSPRSEVDLVADAREPSRSASGRARTCSAHLVAEAEARQHAGLLGGALEIGLDLEPGE
jgi:hypothetical protein